MQRNYQTTYSNSISGQELTTQTAFHEAGHAASIYLGNKLKGLPPVYFQIQIKHQNNTFPYAKVIDGRLIQNLPIAGLNSFQKLTEQEQQNYQTAYQADIISLLVGPLSEAKYISIRDDEALNFNLLSTHALNYYGGYSDVEKAYAYLDYFVSDKNQQEEIMLELFSQAFQFIEKNDNWKCILNLADYILNSTKDVISCEEASEVFDKCLSC